MKELLIGLEIEEILVLVLVVGMGFALSATTATTNLTQQISAGSLLVDVVDGSYNSVASPAVAFASKSVSLSCQSSAGTLGTVTQKVYVQNPDAAGSGWSVTMAATGGSSALWSTGNASKKYDYNDPGTAGCSDTDSDTYAGQLSVNPSVGSIANGQCSSCNTTGVSLGSSSAFSSTGTPVSNITILAASSGASPVGDWTLTGVGLSQTIPAGQRSANDYSIGMTLTVTAV